MKLTGIHFLLSYRCTDECDHCFVWGSPRQGGTMTIDDVRSILDQARDLGTIESIYFEGGEPFLYYVPLCAGVRMARAKRSRTSSSMRFPVRRPRSGRPGGRRPVAESGRAGPKSSARRLHRPPARGSLASPMAPASAGGRRNLRSATGAGVASRPGRAGGAGPC